MLLEIVQHLRDWSWLDTWMWLIAATTALVCTVPGVWLVLRRQSMLGDALSHTVLPGLVGAFLLVNGLQAAGWISPERSGVFEQTLLIAGAAAAGILTAMLTEAVSRVGRIETGAALGVVFSTLFALGLLLIRMFADRVHIDPDCVLFGELESAVLRTVTLGDWRIPGAVVANVVMFIILTLATVLAFKELRVSSFDPGFAGSIGLRTSWIHQILAAMTAVAVVTAFRTVGSILVIALLVGPAAAGRLMSEKLSRVFFWSLAFALAAVTLGIAMAKSLPGVIFPRLGYERVTDAGAAGLIAVACGIVFACAMIVAPRDGAIIKLRDWFVLQVRIAAEDILGLMYRSDERKEAFVRGDMAAVQPVFWRWFAERDLSRRGLITESGGRYSLTETGRRAAGLLVRAHRLWESYMAKHFELSPEHLHETAHSVEHFIDAEMREELTVELDQPAADPHGRSIPPAG